MSPLEKKHEDFRIEEEGQKGWVGAYERFLRRHSEWVHFLTLIPIYAVAAVIFSAALVPAVAFFRESMVLTRDATPATAVLLQAAGIGVGFWIFGFTLILLVPLMNVFVRPFVKPARGQNYSTRFIGWYLHNSLAYMVRYTFLEFITPTPINLFYFRRMGMKMGRGVQINTSNISDPCLIELGDRVTIGGSAVILAHYGMGGYLILSPVVIRSGATIGLHAKILGGVEIGEGAKVLPGSVVLPKTVIPAGETWGGVPASRVDQDR
jgi:acetyltransferase-like isoleucine patch superfamily enzyme